MRRKLLITGLIIVGIIGGLIGQYYREKDSNVALAYNRNNLIRFHVLANSDTPADQALKRKVRDEVVKAMTPIFDNADNLKEARVLAKENLRVMETIAKKTIKNQGYKYPVKVVLGTFQFPVKTYGELTLPAGKYEAVRILIGNAEGANWWCVLFPPLCFVDVSKGLNVDVPAAPVSTDSKPEEEVEQVDVKFKILELLQENDINLDEVKAAIVKKFE
jgi:stage II sporulation protein R